MKRKIDVFCIGLLSLVVLISFWNNFRFVSNHMTSEDANLGVALSGFPFSLLMLATTIHFLLAKKKRLAGMVYIIAAPLLMVFEVIIYVLQDVRSPISLIMMLILYFIVFIFGYVQAQRTFEAEKGNEIEQLQKQ